MNVLGVPYEHWDVSKITKKLSIFDLKHFAPPKLFDNPDFGKPTGGALQGGVFFPAGGYISDPQLATNNLQTASERFGAEYLFNNKVAEIPINILAENAPVYDRKWKKTKLPQKIKFNKDDYKKLKITEVLKKILGLPNISSKEWIWQQYDHTVMGDTIQKPGSDSGVVRIHGTNKAVALLE